ncbi:UNVERIFIED_CONTAM: hypothetical protein K2H54_003651, partial [Gekko kuhli]
MDADIDRLVLDLLMACATARAQRQRCLEAIQRWEEVLIASRRRRDAAWARFLIIWRVRARQHQAQGRRNIRNLLHLADRMPGRRWSTFTWLVDALRDVLHRQQTEMRVPVSVEWRVAVAVWWMANTMSYRAVGHQFGLAQSTVAGIVLEVTRAITEWLLDRVVYLRNPDRVRQGHRGGCQPQRARGRRLDPHRTLEKSQEPMVSLIQIDSSQCIICVEIITLDFCFVMWVDNEPTVGDPVVVVSSSPDRSPASASEAES